MSRSNIAAAINAEHAKVDAAKRAVAHHAIECGRLLTEAKETVSHGEWDAWLKANCRFSARTAQLYMRIYRELHADAAKAQRVADLSLREIDRALSERKPTQPPERRPLTPEGRAWLDRVLACWYSSQPFVRILFMHTLLQRGDIDGEIFERVAQDQLPLVEPDLLPRLEAMIGRAL